MLNNVKDQWHKRGSLFVNRTKLSQRFSKESRVKLKRKQNILAIFAYLILTISSFDTIKA